MISSAICQKIDYGVVPVLLVRTTCTHTHRHIYDHICIIMYIYIYILYTHTHTHYLSIFGNAIRWALMLVHRHCRNSSQPVSACILTSRFLNSKRLCQKQIQRLARFLFAGHVPIFHMVDAMGQSRPSLCQCCTANSGATGGNSAELMNVDEI